MEVIDDIFESNGMKAIKTTSRIAAENGIIDMKLNEINAEIFEAKK